jgi:uncharacterized protein (DUF1778 family)
VKTMGRPPGAKQKAPTKGAILKIRIFAEDKEAIREAAENAGMTITDWIISRCK